MIVYLSINNLDMLHIFLHLMESMTVSIICSHMCSSRVPLIIFPDVSQGPLQTAEG